MDTAPFIAVPPPFLPGTHAKASCVFAFALPGSEGRPTEWGGEKGNTTVRSHFLSVLPGNSKKKIKIKNSFDFMCSKPSLDGSLQQVNPVPADRAPLASQPALSPLRAGTALRVPSYQLGGRRHVHSALFLMFLSFTFNFLTRQARGEPAAEVWQGKQLMPASMLSMVQKLQPRASHGPS